MNKKAETIIEESLFYAFVRLNMPEGEPEFWIIPSFIVANLSYSLLINHKKLIGYNTELYDH